MLTDQEKVILAKWRVVRANAAEADRLLADKPDVKHSMHELVAQCDAAIEKLEAKEREP